MIQEEIKFIAEFMEWKIWVDDGPIQLYKNKDSVKHIAELKFNSSWDLLMPVVEKIEKNKYVDEFNILWCSVYQKHICEITNSYKETFNPIRNDSDNKIESVVKTVIEFIKWYNTTNQENKPSI